MSKDGPVLVLSPQRTPLSPSSFRVKNHVSSPLRFKMLTALPQHHKITALSTIDRKLGEKVLSALAGLYSHVVSRNHAENVVTFFHHVASAALFEADCQQLIKDRDHGKKAGIIFTQVKKVLTILEKHLTENKSTLSENEVKVLKEFISLFIMQHNILLETMNKLQPEVKQHLYLHNSIQLEKLSPLDFTSEHRFLVEGMYPQTPPRERELPLQDKPTPKRKSKEDIKSIAAFQLFKKDVLGQAVNSSTSQPHPSRNLLVAFSTLKERTPPPAISEPSKLALPKLGIKK